MTFVVAVWCALAIGPAVPAGAQEGDVVEVGGVAYEVHGGKLYTLDDPALEDSRQTISVTGSNVDKSKKRVVHADIVTSEEIAESGAHTLADVLADQAGIQVNSSFGLAQDVTLDGLDGRQVLILVDGRPVKGRIDAKVDVSRIPVSASSIERIEIVRGPMSALYGSEAIGGVINIVTKKASQALGGEVEGGGEIVDGAIWENAGVHGRGGGGPIAARVDVNAASLPGIDRNKDGKEDLPDRRQASAHGEVAMPLASTISYQAQIDASSSQSVERTLVGGAFSERDRTDDVSVSSTFGADVPGGVEPGDLSVDIRIDRVHHTFDDLPEGSARTPPSFCSNGGLFFDPACPAKPRLVDDSVENEARVEAKWTDKWLANLPWADELSSLVGVVLLRDSAERTDANGADALPGDKEQDVASTYAELLWKPLPWFSLLPGARADVFTPSAQGENFAIAPKLGARVDLPLGFAVRASYGYGFRLPTFEERLLRFDHSELGYVVVGNANLLPEKSNGVRAEVLYDPIDEVSLSTEWYLNLVDDLIDFKPLPKPDALTGAPVFEYANITRAYTTGINVKASVGPFFGVKLDGGYQYLINAVDSSRCPSSDPYFCASGAVSLPLRPAHALDASLRWRVPWTGTILFSRVDALSERPVSPATATAAAVTAPPYAMFSVGVRQPISFKPDGSAGAEITATLLDLNDAYDATFGPKPGRSFSVLLRVFD